MPLPDIYYPHLAKIRKELPTITQFISKGNKIAPSLIELHQIYGVAMQDASINMQDAYVPRHRASALQH